MNFRVPISWLLLIAFFALWPLRLVYANETPSAPFSAKSEDGAETFCQIALGQQVGFFAEAFSEITGQPLIAASGAPIEGPYSRVYYRKINDNEPVKVAVIAAKDYSLQLEHRLETLGYLGITIRNPSSEAITEKKDFILTWEWFRSVMLTPDSIEHWIESIGSGADKNQLKRKLKKSESIRVETADLNWEDYEIWRIHLFNKYVLTKSGGMPTWNEPKIQSKLLKVPFDPDLPLRGQLVTNLKRVFLYSGDELVGGSLIDLGGDNMVRVRGAAFATKARDLQLAIRAFTVAIELANERHFPYISYGEDLGIFGIDESHGLLQFKTSLGMRFIPSPMIRSTQLIKFFPQTLQKLRGETPLGKFQGLTVFGLSGEDPTRLEQFEHVQRENLTASFSEEKADAVAKIIKGIQLGADQGSDKVKLPRGFKTPEPLPVPKVKTAE